MTIEQLDQLKARERELWQRCQETEKINRAAGKEWLDAHDAIDRAQREMEIEAEVQKRLEAAKTV